jgi:hypothetical protein
MPTLQRIPAERAVESGVRCSFCSREPAEGSDPIAGSDAFICDECLATCNEIMADGSDDQSAAADDTAPARDARRFSRRETDSFKIDPPPFASRSACERVSETCDARRLVKSRRLP